MSCLLASKTCFVTPKSKSEVECSSKVIVLDKLCDSAKVFFFFFWCVLGSSSIWVFRIWSLERLEQCSSPLLTVTCAKPMFSNASNLQSNYFFLSLLGIRNVENGKIKTAQDLTKSSTEDKNLQEKTHQSSSQLDCSILTE